MKKVVVGVSGGVDSSASLLLLKNKGFDVSGVTLKLFDEKISLSKDNSCCSEKDIEDAKKICENLGISHEILSFCDNFEEEVISYFVNSYISGKTPNPCIVCNRKIKFEELLSYADGTGAEFISTGHYASVGFDENSGRYFIKKGKDEKKDQSYVLYGLSQKILSRLVFPLGDYSKEEIRAFAKENGLISAEKKDSQDICFVPDKDYVSFIENYTGKKQKKGDFVSLSGEKIGEHNGIVGYTVGQRKGLGIASTEPYYVIKKDTENNTVILGRENDLYTKSFTVSDINYMAVEKLEKPTKLAVRTRYNQKEKEATVFPLSENEALVEFDESQRAVCPGQSAVFYDGDKIVGGGEIK